MKRPAKGSKFQYFLAFCPICLLFDKHSCSIVLILHYDKKIVTEKSQKDSKNAKLMSTNRFILEWHCHSSGNAFLKYDVICASCTEYYADARDIFRTIFHITVQNLGNSNERNSEFYESKFWSKSKTKNQKVSENSKGNSPYYVRGFVSFFCYSVWFYDHVQPPAKVAKPSRCQPNRGWEILKKRESQFSFTSEISFTNLFSFLDLVKEETRS